MDLDTSKKSVFQMDSTEKVKPEHLAFLREEQGNVVDDVQDVIDRTSEAWDTRLCRWDGQSSDGRKHADDMDGKPFPWENASDMKLRMADQIVNFQVGILLRVARMSSVSVSGLESMDDMVRTKMVTLLSWITNNKLGRHFTTEMERWLQWGLGDSPAVSYLHVFWKREIAREYQTLTIEELAEIAIQQAQIDGMSDPEPIENEAMTVVEAVSDKDRRTEAATWISSVFGIEDKKAKQFVDTLREEGEASLPVAYISMDGPQVSALRLNEDIFVPASTEPAAEPSICFIRTWYTEAELRQKEVSENWNKNFVDDCLAHEGESYFEAYTNNSDEYDKRHYRNKYEVITAIFRSVNEDGITEIRQILFHGSSETDNTARGVERLYKHGKMPIVSFVREAISSRQDDSRSVPELVKDQQNQLKKACDAFSDHVDQNTNPPIKVPRKRPNVDLVIRPNAKIKEDRPGDTEFMKTAEYPQAGDSHKIELRTQISEYFGMPYEGVDPVIVENMQQLLMDRFLPALGEAMTQIVQLCAEFMEPEQLDRVVGGEGMEMSSALEEIQGQYDFVFSMSSKYLDDEKFNETLKTMKDIIMVMDRGQTIQRSALVQWAMRKLDANLAEMAVQPEETADRKEIREERQNFAMMYAGIEPEMAEEGQNWALRLRVIEDAINKNPESWEAWPEQNKQIVQARYEHLQGMAKSTTEYAQAGRTYASPALGDITE